MTRRAVLPATLALLLTGSLVPGAAAASPRVALEGAPAAATQTVCGARHAVATVPPGTGLAAVVAPAHSRRARAARAGSVLVRERCADGTWTRVASRTIGARRGALRWSVPSSTADTGDYRLRTRTRSGRFGPAAYVRVGVGEIVDVPVSFQVVNQNRTSVPCLGAPDGRTYTVHGRLVAPRAVLASGSPAVTLYLHGLGYASWFFRFQDVPGNDYGLQQAQAGHASITVDRLGNPSHDDLPDGNLTCLSSQADMAAQMIAALRAGHYDMQGGATRFDRVILAGHSAGGFITEVEQYSFGAADAIAVISFTDVPSPLAFSQFLASGQDCLTAPQHAHGTTGAPNYAPFGRTDADFAAAHFHDIDPAVASAVLARHNLDPCGDLINAGQALAIDQLGTRSITAPVLIISGADDALFTPPTNSLQGTAFGSQDVKVVELPDTGHAVTLGRTHEAFRAAMDGWLTAHGA